MSHGIAAPPYRIYELHDLYFPFFANNVILGRYTLMSRIKIDNGIRYAVASNCTRKRRDLIDPK